MSNGVDDMEKEWPGKRGKRERQQGKGGKERLTGSDDMGKECPGKRRKRKGNRKDDRGREERND